MRRPVLAFILLATVGVFPAAAATSDFVEFTGTVAPTCSVAASSDGSLKLNGTGDILGSDIAGGTSGKLNILSIGSTTLTVAAPTLESAPLAYVTTGQTLEVQYSGAGGLAGMTAQPYIATQTTRTLGSMASSELTVNNRITNPNGFAVGDYTTRTVVTCAQP